MNEGKEFPDYNTAMTNMVYFIKDIAAKEGITEHDKALQEKAKEVLSDFLMAGLLRLAERGAGRD